MSDSWRLEGACRGLDAELFFPDRGDPTGPAKAICRACPVRAECLDAGMGEHFGIWGAKSERERRGLRRRGRFLRRSS